MSGFLPLTVTDIHRTIRDAVVLTLTPQNPAAFAFVPGQYLTFKHSFSGTEVRRNYSICTGLDDGSLQVGIKQVQGGAFSTFANTALRVGDTLEAMPPAGTFHAPLGGHSYLGFAGGSGITPVLSILRTVLSRQPQARFTLVYANRAVHTIMFREELEGLKNRFMDRLTLIHVLETGQDIDLMSGRLDAAKCDALFDTWIDVAGADAAFICGPEPMMHTVFDALKRHGLAKDRIKMELFGASQKGRLAGATLAEQAQDTTGTTVHVTLDGTSHQIEMAKDQSVLDAALAAQLDAPFACKAGVCSTCKAKLKEGEAQMLSNHALEDYEVEAGFVLTCQCYPLSDTIILDYDQH